MLRSAHIRGSPKGKLDLTELIIRCELIIQEPINVSRDIRDQILF